MSEPGVPPAPPPCALLALPRDVVELIVARLSPADRLALRFIKPFRSLPSVAAPAPPLEKLLLELLRHGATSSGSPSISASPSAAS